MGFISKQSRKGGNQRLAAPVTMKTALSGPQLVDTVIAVCKEHNERVVGEVLRTRETGTTFARLAANGTDLRLVQYHVEVTPDSWILVGYPRTPSWIKAKGDGWFIDAEHWLATLRLLGTPDGGRAVELSLSTWFVDDRGRIKNLDKYEALTAAVRTAVSSDAPSQPSP